MASRAKHKPHSSSPCTVGDNSVANGVPYAIGASRARNMVGLVPTGDAETKRCLAYTAAVLGAAALLRLELGRLHSDLDELRVRTNRLERLATHASKAYSSKHTRSHSRDASITSAETISRSAASKPSGGSLGRPQKVTNEWRKQLASNAAITKVLKLIQKRFKKPNRDGGVAVRVWECSLPCIPFAEPHAACSGCTATERCVATELEQQKRVGSILRWDLPIAVSSTL